MTFTNDNVSLSNGTMNDQITFSAPTIPSTQEGVRVFEIKHAITTTDDIYAGSSLHPSIVRLIVKTDATDAHGIDQSAFPVVIEGASGTTYDLTMLSGSSTGSITIELASSSSAITVTPSSVTLDDGAPTKTVTVKATSSGASRGSEYTAYIEHTVTASTNPAFDG
jgi:hypothetical protein